MAFPSPRNSILFKCTPYVKDNELKRTILALTVMGDLRGPSYCCSDRKSRSTLSMYIVLKFSKVWRRDFQLASAVCVAVFLTTPKCSYFAELIRMMSCILLHAWDTRSNWHTLQMLDFKIFQACSLAGLPYPEWNKIERQIKKQQNGITSLNV